MSDFERAIEVGLAFKVDLTPIQASRGFERLTVLGVRISADERQGAAELERLLTHHANGRAGLKLLAQGTPTNNTEDAGSGYTRGDDPDVSFDERRAGAALRARGGPAAQVRRAVAGRAARPRPAGPGAGRRRGRPGPARRARHADRAVAGDAGLLPRRDDGAADRRRRRRAHAVVLHPSRQRARRGAGDPDRRAALRDPARPPRSAGSAGCGARAPSAWA